MAQFGHTAQSCATCRRDYNGAPPCDMTDICERFTKLHVDDETFPITELPIVRDIIRLWERIVATSGTIVLEDTQRKGDKTYKRRKYIPTMETMGVWLDVFDFEYWGIDKKTLMEWLTMFHTSYVNELRAK